MADIPILGGNTDTRSNIKNLWASVNTISNYLSTGVGNMTYVGTDGSIGKHYKQSSIDGKSCTDSKLLEVDDNFNFGSANLSSIDNITANSFIKSGGTNQQYLMADGSVLEGSGNNSDSNIYLYNNQDGITTPPPNSGRVGYDNSIQGSALNVFISHLTRDNIDVEVFYSSVNTLYDLYIQDQNESKNYIRYNITGPITVVEGSYVSVPVLKIASNGTGQTSFGNGQNVILSFISNLSEVNSRITDLEIKTQNQNAVAGQTNFLGDVNIQDPSAYFIGKFKTDGGFSTEFLKADGSIDSNSYALSSDLSSYLPLSGGYMNGQIDMQNNLITNCNKIMFQDGNTIDNGTNNTNNYNSRKNLLYGTDNINNDDNQIIIGSNNSIKGGSLLSNVIGCNNLDINNINGNLFGSNNTINEGNSQCFGNNNLCKREYSSAFGSDINNTVPNSVCIGDSAIGTIFPNSQICDLGMTTIPFRTIYVSNAIINTATMSNYITNFEASSTYQPLSGMGAYQLVSNMGLYQLVSGMGAYLLKSGGTMTGAITMGTNAINTTQSTFTTNQLVSKNYVDTTVGSYLPLLGSTMTGPITMGTNAINTTQSTFTTNQLVSKNYVDTTVGSYLPKSGGTMTGSINMGATQITNVSKITTNGGTFNFGTNNDNYTSTSFNVVCGNSNTINANEQIIMGSGNSSISNQTNIFGSNNTNINTGLGNVFGRSNSISGPSNVQCFGNSNTIGASGYYNVCIGTTNSCNAQYASAIGSDIINNTSNSLCLGNSAISTIFPNSLVCDLGTSTIPFKDIYYTGKLISATNPILNITNTATLFYNNITLSTSNSSFIPNTSLTFVGGSVSQVSQAITNNKTKLFKTLLLPTATGSYQPNGLNGNTAFLLNSQALYVGMGFNIKYSFGVADGGSAVTNSTAGMFVGLIGATAIAWSASLLPTTLINCIGIGHDPLASNISFIFRGSLTTGSTIATQWNTSTPDNRWFHLSITNQFNSNNVVITLTEALSNISETRTFTCGVDTSTLGTSVRVYPCIQRMMGGGGGVPQSAQLHFGQLTYNQLI